MALALRLVILVSMAALALSASLDADLCGKGESFWCQSLEAAEVCSAVDHCRETIWKNQKLETDESTTCVFCEAIISDVRTMSTAGKLQDEVIAYLSSANDLLPDTDKASQIKKTIERKSFPKLLNSEIAPQMVCNLLDLCKGLQVEGDLHQPKSSLEEKPEKPSVTNDVSLSQPTICNDCKAFFAALKKLITVQTPALLTDVFLEKVCIRATAYKPQCVHFANTTLPDIIQLLAGFLDEERVCKGMRLCPKSQIESEENPFWVDFRSIVWEEVVSPQAKQQKMDNTDKRRQTTSCKDCKDLFNSLKSFLTNEAATLINDVLIDKVCSRLGTRQRACAGTVKALVPAVIGFALDFLDTNQVCTKMTLCSKSQSDIGLRSLIWTKLIRPNGTDMLPGPTSCNDCTKFFSSVRDLLKGDAPAFLTDVIVDQICPLTGAFRKQCEGYAKTYLKTAIGLVTSFLDPNKVCKAIGECKKYGDETETDLFLIDLSSIDWETLGRDQMLPGPTSCSDCTKFFTSVRDLLKGDASAFLTNVIVDQICPLTGTFRKQCEDYAKTYLKTVIGLVASVLDPNKVCNAIGECKKYGDETESDPFLIDLSSIDWETLIEDQMLPGPTSCSDCTKFFSSVRDLLKGDASAFLTDVIVDQICPLTGAFRKQCEDFAKTYLKTVIGLVTSNLDPNKVCKAIGECKKYGDETETDLFLIDLSSIDWDTLSRDQGVSKCEACKTAVQFVQNFLKSETVKTSLAMIIKKFVCVMLGPFRFPCEKMVGYELRALLDLVARLLDPSKVCRMIRLCPKSDVFMVEEKDDSLPVLEVSEKVNDIECTVCETVIGVVRAAIDFNSTEGEILKGMHGLCGRLPSKSVVAVCNNFVNKYGHLVIDLIRRSLQPNDICKKLGLCSVLNFDLEDVVTLVGSEPCVICKSVVQYLEAFVDQTDTVSMIQTQFKNLCHSLPPAVERDVCLPFVEKNIPPLIHELSVLLPPKLFCTKIRVCPNEVEE